MIDGQRERDIRAFAVALTARFRTRAPQVVETQLDGATGPVAATWQRIGVHAREILGDEPPAARLDRTSGG